MILSSMCLVRNPQCPPSTPLLDTSFLTHFQLGYQQELFKVCSLGWKNIIHDIRNDPGLHVSGQEPPNILQVPPFLTPLPDRLPIEISTQNFQGIFLGVKKHHSWRQEWPCPPCLRSGTLNVLQVPPFLTPPSWHTSNWVISMKFSGHLPWGKKHHSWGQEWPCPPCLQSGTLNILQVPPLLTPLLTHF